MLLEGQTENIFFEYLLPEIQTEDRLYVSRKLTDVLTNDIHLNKIWIKDVRGDGSFVTYIKRNLPAFTKNKFDHIVCIRDYHPDHKPQSLLCKQELCLNMLNNMPDMIKSNYTDRIFINLSVIAIESWFFADKQIFQKIHHDLSIDYINDKFNNILNNNPEDMQNPKKEFVNIIRSKIPNYKYRKRKDELYSIFSKYDFPEVIVNNNISSLKRAVNFLLNALS